ncbi:Uncharacterized protein PBTT_06375 [Plasmodiophora brassicae]|nr:hypothetical protein PBRA_007472 [Plasmodiophora brassicae]
MMFPSITLAICCFIGAAWASAMYDGDKFCELVRQTPLDLGRIKSYLVENRDGFVLDSTQGEAYPDGPEPPARVLVLYDVITYCGVEDVGVVTSVIEHIADDVFPAMGGERAALNELKAALKLLDDEDSGLDDGYRLGLQDSLGRIIRRREFSLLLPDDKAFGRQRYDSGIALADEPAARPA